MHFWPLLCILLFVLVAFGPAWRFVAKLNFQPEEKVLASVACSLLFTFLIAWAKYVFALPSTVLWAVPAIAIISLATGFRSLVEIARDTGVRNLLFGQAVVTAWCVGGLALIQTYSGGGWTSDWFEHWERARFFHERGPMDTLFIGHATITARPPLANIITSALMALTRVDFAHYQVFSTVFASLGFLPAAVLARCYGDVRSVGVLALLFMLNPLVVQNATFAWTKLPAAFFTLVALHFFLRARDSISPIGPALLCATMLAAGTLAHYSTGPYVVLLVIGWLLVTWCRRAERTWWVATAGAGVAGAAILAVWFGWAVALFGAAGTMLSNTSVTAAESTVFGQLSRICANLRDTLVPHFLRPLDMTLIRQTSSWGAVRDWWFQLYQLNLFFALGSIAWLPIAVVAWRTQKQTTPSARWGWIGFVAGAIVLGVGVHGARDTWGLAHICLQPLILLALAFLAARWHGLSSHWRTLLVAGMIVDFLLGIALHFSVQNLAFERWAGPSAFATWQENNTTGAVMNMAAKHHHRLLFLNDVVNPPLVILTPFLLVLLWFVARRVRLTTTISGPTP